MTQKGQIVEIPASSVIYSRDLPFFNSKIDELIWKSHEKEYSLFDGFLVGEHDGVENFKIGQRKGINVGGKKEPLYVIWIDRGENRLFVGAGDTHPGLLTNVIRLDKKLELIDLNFSEDELEKGIDVEVSSSTGQNRIPAKLYGFDNSLFLEFKNEISVLTENNPFNIIYKDKIIKKVIKN